MIEGDAVAQRLHPLTIVKELASVGWAIVAVAIGFEIPVGPVDVPNQDIIIAIGVFAYAVMRYLFTSYTVNAATLEMRRGVFVKTTQTMPRDRIQSVDVNTPFLGRFLGLSTVNVSAADVAQISLSYVSDAQAEHLRALLHRSDGPTTEDAELATEIVIDEPGIGEVLLYGVTTTSTVVTFLVGVTVVTMAVLFGAWFALIGGLGPLIGVPIAILSGIVGLKSWIDGDRLRVVKGLFGRTESNSPLERIQTVIVSRPALRRLLGFESVRAVSGDPVVDIGSLGPVAPLIRIGEWRRVSRLVFGRDPLPESGLARSSPFTKRRAFLRGSAGSAALAVVVGLVVGVLSDFVAGVVAGFVVLGFGLCVSWWYARRRYEALGWLSDGHDLLVRKGVFTETVAIVPIHKIQDVAISETYFQRRLGIATVEIDTAGVTGRSLVAVDLEVGVAADLARSLAMTAATVALPDGV